jgi:alkylated DNA repair dioxygenase AlkB
VSAEEEARLIAEVDKGTWNTSLKRRTQHYGIEYDYKKKWISSDDAATATLPSWCQFLIDRLHERHIISSNPVQLLVNEYEPGQGIARHSDSPAFGDLVLSLSLGSTCIMQLRNGEDCIDVPLEPRSLLVLSGEARWKWTHEIPARKSDVIEGGKVLSSTAFEHMICVQCRGLASVIHVLASFPTDIDLI